MIPGLGADDRLFEYQVNHFNNITVLPLLKAEKHETPEEYAIRISCNLVKSESTVVCGVSFGGVLAPYIAKHIDAKVCILVSSLQYPCQFPWYYRLFKPFVMCSLFTRMILWLSKIVLLVVWPILRVLLPKDLLSICVQYITSSTAKMASLLRLLYVWVYTPEDKRFSRDCIAYVIHGANDKIIPIHFVSPHFTVGGGHFLPLTHPTIINDTISAITARVQTDSSAPESP